MDENRERRAIFNGFRTIVERPFRFRAGADSIVPADVIAIMWWGKMAGVRFYRRSTVENTARLAPPNCSTLLGWKRGGRICWKNFGLLRAYSSMNDRGTKRSRMKIVKLSFAFNCNCLFLVRKGGGSWYYWKYFFVVKKEEKVCLPFVRLHVRILLLQTFSSTSKRLHP